MLDDFVGLEADLLDERHPQGVEHLLDQGDLSLELVGRLRPVGLVVGVLLGPGKVALDTSKATARWVGCSSWIRSMSIAVEP